MFQPRASLFTFVVIGVTGLIDLGCGAQAATPNEPSSTRSQRQYTAVETEGAIPREQLVYVLDHGLPQFLRGVETEAHVEDGEFVGHRLVSMYPDDPRFAALAMGPGDTVLRVNGRSIARPEQAFEVWESLRVASQLWVEYLSEGQSREIRFDIVD